MMHLNLNKFEKFSFGYSKPKQAKFYFMRP